jgi:DNA-binding phage protein
MVGFDAVLGTMDVPLELRIALGQRQTIVTELCKQLGVTRQTLYRHLGPDGSLREDGQKVLAR